MNKKGFSILGALISVIVLLFVVQFAMKQYKKSLSSVSAVKLAGVNPKAGKNSQGTSLQDGIMLKVSVLPQLDNLLRDQQAFLMANGSYAKNISSLSTNPTPVPQYVFGVSDNKAGWIVWVKKTGGNNKFFLFKNINTKQLCCKDIDNESCQYLDIGAKKCPF